MIETRSTTPLSPPPPSPARRVAPTPAIHVTPLTDPNLFLSQLTTLRLLADASKDGLRRNDGGGLSAPAPMLAAETGDNKGARFKDDMLDEMRRVEATLSVEVLEGTERGYKTYPTTKPGNVIVHVPRKGQRPIVCGTYAEVRESEREGGVEFILVMTKKPQNYPNPSSFFSHRAKSVPWPWLRPSFN